LPTWVSRRVGGAPRAREIVEDHTRSDEIELADVRELDARFALIDGEERRLRDRRLGTRLDRLVERRVPVRSIEAAPALHAACIRFADGTELLVKGERPGDAGVLAMWVRHGSVVPLSKSSDGGTLRLVFGTSFGPQRLAALVIGLSQPD